MKIIYVPSIFILVIMCNIFCASDHIVTIERYQSVRDKEAVQKICNDHYNYLMYESLGLPEGTTMKYIESKNYITDVLRVNNKIVGFVNYTLKDWYLLTFYLGRYAMVNLMGVDTEHQYQGYGTRLLKHSMLELQKLQASTIMLTVQKDNVRARKLYEKEGFLLKFPVVENIIGGLIYTYKLDVLPDNLPQGNIIQRNKRTAAALFVSGATLLLWAFSLHTSWARYIPKWKTHE